MPVRTMALWCPDWPVRAGGADPAAAVAVVKANRVVAASAPARAEGVEVGQRRRQAESRCPGLAVVQLDEGRDARAFEPVVQAVSAFAPRVEVVRPGEAAFAVRGPARYFGGERRLGRLVADAADAACPGGPGGGPPCRVGVADGPFAAALAARRGIVVPAGATPRFLAPLPVEAMGLPDLADLLVRLGIRTLGQLGELPSTQVLSRFGPEGERAHRLARGLDERLLDARPPAEDLAVVVELDPPVERVDAAAFAAKTAADRLHACMQERGLVCAQVAIEAESEHGERLSRRWRHDGGLTASSLADRVRWQLEGWLTGPNPPTAGLVLIRLEPDGLAPARGLQPGFWGGAAESDDQAARGLARVQALLGPDAVLVTVPDGGRSAGDQVRLVPWGDDRVPARPTVCPWPGRVPGAAPVVVPAHPEPVELLDGDGRPVQVSGRGLISAAPRLLRTAGGDGVVTGWSAPWPCHERWWAPSGRRRVARLQVLTADGRALLLAVDRGRWAVEGVY